MGECNEHSEKYYVVIDYKHFDMAPCNSNVYNKGHEE
jgi:hypothetical protein